MWRCWTRHAVFKRGRSSIRIQPEQCLVHRLRSGYNRCLVHRFPWQHNDGHHLTQTWAREQVTDTTHDQPCHRQSHNHRAGVPSCHKLGGERKSRDKRRPHLSMERFHQRNRWWVNCFFCYSKSISQFLRRILHTIDKCQYVKATRRKKMLSHCYDSDDGLPLGLTITEIIFLWLIPEDADNQTTE